MSKAWQIGIIILVTTVAYLNIFGNGFVIDDQYFIKEWELTRSWGSVGQLLAGANPESQPGVYRPIRSLLYLVYYQLWGTNPFFYHLHSLLVHLAATVLVFLIVDQLSFPRKRESREEKTGSPIRSGMTAFIAALLFGLHPIHTESITYIAASMEMTGVVFMLGAFWLFVRSPRRRNGLAMTLSVFLALLAFFTYEMTITLPILLVLYELILRVPSVIPAQAGIQRRKDWIPVFTGMTQRVLPYFVGAAGFFAVRFALGVGLGRGEYLAYSFFHTQLAMTKMWVKYLSLLVWPVTLSHNHTVVLGFEAFMTPYSDQAAILSQTILDPEILLAIGVIGGIGVMGWKMRKKYPLVSFCVGWFFISMLPVAYFFPQGTAIAEKYLYIASFGFVLSVAFLLTSLKSPRILRVLICIIVLFYGARTAIRNADWSSPRTLWEYEARIHPKSELAYYNLGIIYGQSGEKEKAVAAYTKALDLKPQFWQAKHNLQKL